MTNLLHSLGLREEIIDILIDFSGGNYDEDYAEGYVDKFVSLIDKYVKEVIGENEEIHCPEFSDNDTSENIKNGYRIDLRDEQLERHNKLIGKK